MSITKLKIMMNKSTLEELSQLKREYMVCVGCQYGKTNQLPFKKLSKFIAKQSLKLVHFDVFGPIKWHALHGVLY